MPISAERFQWALDRVDPSQWRYFERLATVFLAGEFASLRPVSAMSGDGGADAMLFEIEDDPSVILQFSVRKDYSSKIEETCKRLRTTHPAATVLIYVTNQAIGPESVSLRKSAREKYSLYLDPRDREWLISVRNSSAAAMAEAEALAHTIVDPLLGESGEAISQQAQALDDLEAKAAFVYLGLQWADDTREKGLTKLCFEAIVRSVLRDTTSERRKSRSEVRELVRQLLPGQHARTLEAQVDGALSRLNKRYIRTWKKQDEFCLTWDERVRLADRLADLSVMDGDLRLRLRELLATSFSEIGEETDPVTIDEHVEFSRTVIERVLLDRGEAFAVAVTRESGGDVRSADVEAVIDAVVERKRFRLQLPPHVLTAALQGLLVAPPEDVRRYLRSLADTYTLFAFMRETPDVQSAVVKLFSEGDIWLDTSFLLPLFAEDLIDPDLRSHTELIKSARECGLRLYLTEGVLEEVVTHIRRSLFYERARHLEGAQGAAPFLLGAYELAGQPSAEFERWIEEFYGSDPEADIAEYLEDVHGIRLSSLVEFAERAPIEWRAAAAEVWHEARDYRDRRNTAIGLPPMDSLTRDKLISHDVENYLGILIRREDRNERRSPFGYKSWWLTLDKTAYRVDARIAELVDHGRPPASPAISPDFMLNYLAIGPVRARLSRKSEQTLPLMINMAVLDAVPADLISLATELREQLAGRNPRVIRRKIRETLEDARRLLGPKANGGELGLSEDVRARLIASAKSR